MQILTKYGKQFVTLLHSEPKPMGLDASMWGTPQLYTLCSHLTQEEPDVPFTEEEYRKRRTHPNFKDHITTEKLVIKLGKTVSYKNRIGTYSSLYGMGLQ